MPEYRGISHYFSGKGLGRFRRVVADSGFDTTPVYPPVHVKATATPTKTPVQGDLYVDSTADTLKLYDGSQWVDAGGVHLLPFQLKPFATVTEYDLMVAVRPFKVVAISYVPSTLQGGALTATVVKATGTSAPANGTTPLHSANGINLNANAYTVVNLTLTATAADLSFAAGDRLGIDFSAAYSTGHAALTVAIVYV